MEHALPFPEPEGAAHAAVGPEDGLGGLAFAPQVRQVVAQERWGGIAQGARAVRLQEGLQRAQDVPVPGYAAGGEVEGLAAR